MPELATPFLQLGPLERAAFVAVCYAGIFEYPLKAAEVHRSLYRYRTYPEAVVAALRDGEPLRSFVDRDGDYFFLRGEEDLARRRSEREVRSRGFLKRYGPILAAVRGLPFVDAVAISGALAFSNLRDDREDLDLFVVSAPGRLWLANTTLWAHRRTRRGPLCINYLVSRDNLQIPYRNFYNAHQLIHLRPVGGTQTVEALWRENPWLDEVFPNHRADAGERDAFVGAADAPEPAWQGPARRALDRLTAGEAGDWLDERVRDGWMRWRRRRETDNTQAETYDRRTFKRHPNDHRRVVVERLAQRLRAAGWPEDEIPKAD